MNRLGFVTSSHPAIASLANVTRDDIGKARPRQACFMRPPGETCLDCTNW